MLDRAIRDPKSDNRPLDLSFLDDILEHVRKPRPSDSDKIDKRLLIKFNQFSSNSKSIKSNLIGTKSASPVLIKNIGQMKRSHLENALSYTLENSETAYNEMFLECDKQFILETWLNDFDLTKDYNEAMHLVFSIKDKPDEEIMHGLLNSTWETLKVRLPEYKFALVPLLEQDLKTKEEEFKRAKESYFKALESYKETFSLKEDQDFLKQNKQFSKLSKDILYTCNEIIGANRFLTHYDISQLQKVLEHAKDTKLEQKEIQAITKEPNNDEPWIEYGKLMQEKAKAHYQAMLEKERAKQLVKEQKETLHTNELVYDPKTHAGLRKR
ncbi:hypothetical protein HpMS53_02820 [Helicobacter pylori]